MKAPTGPLPRRAKSPRLRHTAERSAGIFHHRGTEGTELFEFELGF